MAVKDGGDEPPSRDSGQIPAKPGIKYTIYWIRHAGRFAY
jgi:hypothetical protein